jgi:putative transcriptional regulator
MSIKYHLTEPLIGAYAAGSLPEAYSLVVATHVSLCDECRAALEAHEALGGALLEEAGSAGMSEDSLARTLAKIDRGGPAAGRVSHGTLPMPLQDYVGGDLDAVKWHAVGGGVRQAVLMRRGRASVRLLQIPAGQAMPEHGHRGIELTLVLKGAFRDQAARFGRGDVEIADASDQHTPVAEAGEDCICLAATDAPLRFVSILPRLVQPFIGI